VNTGGKSPTLEDIGFSRKRRREKAFQRKGTGKARSQE
jgi:hypothetical protein